MMSRFAALAGGVIVASLCATLCPAEEVLLECVQDNTLYESVDGNLSNGVGSYFFAGKTSVTDELRRGLIQFDIAGMVPKNATIETVELTLYMSRSISGEEPVSLHRALEEWGEGKSNAPGQEGAGTIAQPGDATWSFRLYPGAEWAVLGGTFASNETATIIVDDIGYYTWSSEDGNDGMVQTVQSWLDFPDNNYGWAVIGNELAPTFTPTAKRFDTRESTTVARRPVLLVVYSMDVEPCRGDLAGEMGSPPDGSVNLFDLLALLAAWGTNGNGADLADPTDIVNLFDLLELLSLWGACP